jgi:hypothetical protein
VAQWKIKACEWSEVLERCGVISPGCFFSGRVKTKIQLLIIDANTGMEFICVLAVRKRLDNQKYYFETEA